MVQETKLIKDFKVLGYQTGNKFYLKEKSSVEDFDFVEFYLDNEIYKLFIFKEVHAQSRNELYKNIVNTYFNLVKFFFLNKINNIPEISVIVFKKDKKKVDVFHWSENPNSYMSP
jgi:hypothetical protein